MNQVQAKYKLVGSPLQRGRRTVAAYFVYTTRCTG